MTTKMLTVCFMYSSGINIEVIDITIKGYAKIEYNLWNFENYLLNKHYIN